MEADFTLVPIGGLGNRINAICSAIVYCRQHRKTLKILWFKDPGLNCPVEDLFSLDTALDFVELKNATYPDFVLRDNPRRRNFRIPTIFQSFLFDRCIYEKEVYRVVSSKEQRDFGSIDAYKHIFMVSYWRFWESDDMWKVLVLNPHIEQCVQQEIHPFQSSARIGIHIRRTDNTYSVKESPLDLFIQKIEEEIKARKGDVLFYLASDSPEVKTTLKNKFGDKIYTSMKPVRRNTRQGIVDAFVELNILSRMDKIYASSQSSFSELAHLLSGNAFEELKIKS